MGKRGPQPKSDILKFVSGSRKPLSGTHSPTPTLGKPVMPEWLSNPAKAHWREIVPELELAGMLSVIDQSILAAYCQSFAEMQEAVETINKEKRIITLPNGIRTIHPACKLLRSAMAAVKSLAVELGLTPQSRQRLSVPDAPEDTDDELAKLIDRNKGKKPSA